MADIIQQAVDEGMASYNGVKTFSSEVRLRLALEAAARRAIHLSQAEPTVSAREVFRISGGDIECCPNPTPEDAMECLSDLRKCYDESLAQQPAEAVAGFIDSEQLEELKRGGCAAIQLGTYSKRYRRTLPVYTSPPPAIDIGKLRELVARWCADKADDAHSTSIWDQGYAHARSECADELAALIGDGGERA